MALSVACRRVGLAEMGYSNTSNRLIISFDVLQASPMLCVAASPEFESSVCMTCSPPTGSRARIATRTLIHEQRTWILSIYPWWGNALRTEAFKLTLDKTLGMCKPCTIQEASCRESWACWVLRSEKKKTSRACVGVCVCECVCVCVCVSSAVLICSHISERSAGLHPSIIDGSSSTWST